MSTSRQCSPRARPGTALLAAALALLPLSATAAEPAVSLTPVEPRQNRDILSAEQWKSLDLATDRALAHLAKKQRRDGSFEAPSIGQPGVTSLCVMAFLSRGHIPHEGPYGAQLDKAIEYVLGTQKPSGVFSSHELDQSVGRENTAETGTYNHAMAGLMLGEVYGMTHSVQRDRLRGAISKAIEYTRARQVSPNRSPHNGGGWRYFRALRGVSNDADLSATAWHVMFLRSARNAEFEVPKVFIDEAMAYVRRTFSPQTGTFMYQANGDGLTTRSSAGSGILLLSLGGDYQTDMAKTAGDWILKHPFDRYNQPALKYDRYHYSAYYCSQGMFQLGGEYWARFYPPMLHAFVTNQRADGSWDAESNRDGWVGNTYTTALAVLALTPPYQLLPIYQR